MIIGEHIQPAYLSTPHGRVHYLESGTGTGTTTKAILLFHETPLSAKSFLPTMPYLAAHIRVIAFDTPGYGGSAPRAGKPSIEGYVETLWAAIQQLGLDQVAVCGIHTGATISVELASRDRPGPKIIGAVLSGVTLMDAEAQKQLATLAERDTRDGEISMLLEEETILQSWRDRVRRWVRAPVGLLVQALADELAAFPNRNEGFKAVRDHDMAAAIARVKVPVLVLNGEHDSMAKIDAAAVSLFRDAKLELVPDWGGQLQGSAPKLYADHLLDFLLPKFSR